MSEKKKFTIEYEIKSSPRILYGFLGEHKKRKLLAVKENKLISFKWGDDEPQCFFEMEILQDELTNDVALSITDFAVEETISERKLIWDNKVEYLISVLGA